MASPLSPEVQRDKLFSKLVALGSDVRRVENYFNGDHPLAFATKKFRLAFGDQLQEFASNWAPIVIDTAVERLAVEGFRLGDKDKEDLVWDVWQANALDTESDIVHSEACKHGTAYVLVDPSESDPIITVEHPSQVITSTDPTNRRKVTSALKSWRDDDTGYVYANLYLPTAIYKWRSDQPTRNGIGRPRFVPIEGGGTNPLGVVPIVRFENNPSLLQGGTSDLRDVMPLNDGINKLMCDLLVASEFYAFPQRVFLGIDDAEDENGEPIPFTVPSHLAQAITLPEGADVKSLEASALTPYMGAIQEFLKQVAAITRTPPNYLLGQMVNLSGEALLAAEKGLTSKVKRKQRNFKSSWVTVANLILVAKGQPPVATGEVVWANPESLTPAQIADPLVKLREGLNVPYEVLWGLYGFSPQQIEEMRQTMNLPKPGESVLPALTNTNTEDIPTSG